MGILLFAAAFAGYLYFVVWMQRGFSKLRRHKPLSPATQHSFSVIIAAHNEAAAIPRLLEALSRQNYPVDKFEVILVADRCTDDTATIARSFENRFSALTVIEIDSVPEGISPKKFALQRGIRQARFEHLLFLDADVIPTPNHLRTFNRYFSDNVAAVVSIMKFIPPKTVWQRFLVYEKLISWCTAAAAIGHGRPIIAYGGNWGYTRSAFKAVDGFDAIFDSLSGDDDLLLQKMGEQRLPIVMCLAPEGWIRTAPPDTFGHFLRQRRRHFSAGKKYPPGVQLAYFCYHLLNLFLWVGGWFYLPGLGFLGAKWVADGIIVYQGMKMFREHFNPIEMPFFNGLYFLYNTLIGPLGHIGKIRW